MQNMKKIILPLIAMLGILLPAQSQQRPNVIFILADDLGYGDLSCLNPGSKISTPNIDRLARQGKTFPDAHNPPPPWPPAPAAGGAAGAPPAAAPAAATGTDSAAGSGSLAGDA